MPTFRTDPSLQSRPYQARVQYKGERFNLGHFSSWEEAKEAENRFREENKIHDFSHRAPSFSKSKRRYMQENQKPAPHHRDPSSQSDADYTLDYM